MSLFHLGIAPSLISAQSTGRCLTVRRGHNNRNVPYLKNLVPIATPVVAPELFLSTNLGFVRETSLLGGSQLFARQWAHRQERK